MVDMPDPPDPYAQAEAQAKFSKEAAVAQQGLNSTNQITPEGSLIFSEAGKWSDGTPRFESTQTYSPENQEIFGLGMAAKKNLAGIGVDQSAKIKDILSSPLSLNIGGMPVGPDASKFTMPGGAPAPRYAPDPTLVGRQDIASNDALAKQLFDAGMTRMRPEIDRRRETLDASLADKGFTVGSEGYTRSMGANAQDENDRINSLFLSGQQQAFDQARARAGDTFAQDTSRFGNFFTQGAAKAANDFGQDLASRAQSAQENDAAFNRAQTAYGNDVRGRQQTIDEILLGRNQPLNEIIGLMSGSQIQKPTWTSTPQANIAAPDFIGASNAAYQAQAQQASGAMSGLGSIFGSLLKLPFMGLPSDRRLKRNIARIGEFANGLPSYLYRYFWRDDWFIGLMADDVRKVKPEAVTVDADGYDMVDYGQALGAF